MDGCRRCRAVRATPWIIFSICPDLRTIIQASLCAFLACTSRETPLMAIIPVVCSESSLNATCRRTQIRKYCWFPFSESAVWPMRPLALSVEKCSLYSSSRTKYMNSFAKCGIETGERSRTPGCKATIMLPAASVRILASEMVISFAAHLIMKDSSLSFSAVQSLETSSLGSFCTTICVISLFPVAMRRSAQPRAGYALRNLSQMDCIMQQMFWWPAALQRLSHAPTRNICASALSFSFRAASHFPSPTSMLSP